MILIIADVGALDGPGIDVRSVLRATLLPGFSTTASLGLGFTIMLRYCRCVLMATQPGRTTIVLEIAATSREVGETPSDGQPAPSAVAEAAPARDGFCPTRRSA